MNNEIGFLNPNPFCSDVEMFINEDDSAVKTVILEGEMEDALTCEIFTD